MFETVIIVLGILGLAAFLGGKIGYLLGAKRATSAIADCFKREIASTDNDLKKVDELVRRRTLVSDGSLGTIAEILRAAAWNEGMEEQARSNETKPDQPSVTMRTSDLDDVADLAGIGLLACLWEDASPFRQDAHPLTRERAAALADMLDRFEGAIIWDLRFRQPHVRLDLKKAVPLLFMFSILSSRAGAGLG